MFTLVSKIVFRTAIIVVLTSTSVFAASSSNVQMVTPRLDVTDLESVKRGGEYFFQKCITCHSAQYIRYNRMMEDIGFSAEYLKNYLPEGHKLTDGVKSNLTEAAGIEAYGIAPPDLSLVARERGTTWLYNFFISFYQDENAKNGSNNAVFPNTAMPNQFLAEQGFQEPVYSKPDANGVQHVIGVKPQTENPEGFKAFRTQINDLVNFLDYIGEPAKIQRLAMGKWVILFLLGLLVLVWLLKRAYWQDIK